MEAQVYRGIQYELQENGEGRWVAWSGGRRLTDWHYNPEFIAQKAEHAINLILDENPRWHPPFAQSWQPLNKANEL